MSDNETTIDNINDLPTGLEKPKVYFRGIIHMILKKKKVNISKKLKKFTAKYPELATINPGPSARTSIAPAAPSVVTRTAARTSLAPAASSVVTRTAARTSIAPAPAPRTSARIAAKASVESAVVTGASLAKNSDSNSISNEIFV